MFAGCTLASFFPEVQKPKQVSRDYFGVTHAGTKSEHYGLAKTMGAVWFRVDFRWADIEPRKGDWHFSGYDAFVNRSKAENRKILAVLCYDTPWIHEEGKSKEFYISPDRVPDFLRFVRKTAARYAGKVDAFEIWNEPNLDRFWKGTMAEFMDLTVRAAAEIRAVAPGTVIVGGSFNGAPETFLPQMSRLGLFESLDVISFHPYGVNPANVATMSNDFVAAARAQGFNGELWITEIGYPTLGIFPNVVSEERFPEYVAKTLAGAIVSGVSKLIWYTFENDPDYGPGQVAPGDSPVRRSESTYGLAYDGLVLKKGGHAYSIVANLVNGSSLRPDLVETSGLPRNATLLAFHSRSQGLVILAWNDGTVGRLSLRTPASMALLHEIDGSGLSVIDTSEERAFNLDSRPLVLVFPEFKSPLPPPLATFTFTEANTR